MGILAHEVLFLADVSSISIRRLRPFQTHYSQCMFDFRSHCPTISHMHLMLGMGVDSILVLSLPSVDTRHSFCILSRLGSSSSHMWDPLVSLDFNSQHFWLVQPLVRYSENVYGIARQPPIRIWTQIKLWKMSHLEVFDV